MTRRKGKVIATTTWFAVVEPHTLSVARNAGRKSLGTRIPGYDVIDLGCPGLGNEQKQVGRYPDQAEAEKVMTTLNLERTIYLTEKGLLLDD